MVMPTQEERFLAGYGVLRPTEIAMAAFDTIIDNLGKSLVEATIHHLFAYISIQFLQNA